MRTSSGHKRVESSASQEQKRSQCLHTLQNLLPGRQGSLDLRQADTASALLARVVVLSGKVCFQPGGKERARGKNKRPAHVWRCEGFVTPLHVVMDRIKGVLRHSFKEDRCPTGQAHPWRQAWGGLLLVHRASCLETRTPFQKVPRLQQHRHDFPNRRQLLPLTVYFVYECVIATVTRAGTTGEPVWTWQRLYQSR